MQQRKLFQKLKWETDSIGDYPSIYSCCFAKGKEDFIIAASVGLNELKLFEYDYGCYKSTWKTDGLDKGVFSCDICPGNDMIAFGGADKNVYLCALSSVI